MLHGQCHRQMPFALGNSELSCVIAGLRVPVLGMPYPERDLAGNGYSTPRPASGRPVTFEDVMDLGHLVGDVMAPNAECALRVDPLRLLIFAAGTVFRNKLEQARGTLTDRQFITLPSRHGILVNANLLCQLFLGEP